MSGNIAALRLKNRIYAGTLTGAQLQAELADNYQLGAWRQLCAEGESIAQMLSVPELRPVLQASPAATDEILRAGYAVGRTLEVLLPGPSAELRACNTFERLLADPSQVQRLTSSSAGLNLLTSSPWGTAALRTAFASYAKSPLGINLLNLTISNQQFLDFVLSDPVSAAAFRNTTVLAKSEVPPQSQYGGGVGGQASASSYISSYTPGLAFDKTSPSNWISSGVTNQWLRFSFTNPIFVHTVTINNGSAVNTGVKNAIVQASIDGAVWTDLLSVQIPQSNSEQICYINKAGRFAHWRVLCQSNWGNLNNVSLAELNFIGFQ